MIETSRKVGWSPASIDYHNRKADYVAKFMDHVDWAEVNARYRMATS